MFPYRSTSPYTPSHTYFPTVRRDMRCPLGGTSWRDTNRWTFERSGDLNSLKIPPK